MDDSSKQWQCRRRWEPSNNVLHLMQCRQLHCSVGRLLQRRSQFTESLLKRLTLEKELEGHLGCVNCLQWNSDGSRLLSGSDDTTAILWDPFRHRQVHVIPTTHIGNIFSVKFLTDESIIATAGGDCKVVVQSIEKAVAKATPLIDCSCHLARVKRLATAPDNPAIFWSASEDGLVMQFDLRDVHSCPTKRKQILIDFFCKLEVKCIAVNPTQTQYIAIGANDCFVRLYDRRFLKLNELNRCIVDSVRNDAFTNIVAPGCVQYFAPGQLVSRYANLLNSKLATTYVAFNSSGSELLANIGGEQIYLFDVNNGRNINEMKIPRTTSNKKPQFLHTCCLEFDVDAAMSGSRIENGIPDNISETSLCACCFMKRATIFYRRKWTSDMYAAARDFLYVIQNWPECAPGYVGLIRCLLELGWVKEADEWFKHFTALLPNVNSLQHIINLKRNVGGAMANCTKVAPSSVDVGILMGSAGNGNRDAALDVPAGELILNSSRRDDVEADTTRQSPDAQAFIYDPEGFAADDFHELNAVHNGHHRLSEHEDEHNIRLNSFDYERRFIGHCNTTTDIKEANFLGEDDNFLCAGSDEGVIYLWDKTNPHPIGALVGDSSIVNCVQPHPSTCLLASSGIDPVVKLWSPMPEDGRKNKMLVDPRRLKKMMITNQHRMAMDPFESMLASMGYRNIGGIDELGNACRTC